MFLKNIFRQRNHELVAIRKDATIADAARLLVAHKIGALLVTDAAGEMVGILSERDLARCIHSHAERGPGKAVSEFMTPDPVSCSIDDALESVMTVMNERHIRHLPVMDGERVIGMVSIRDVVGHLLEAASFERDALKEYIAASG